MSKELTIVDTKNYLALGSDNDRMMEIYEENVGAGGLDESDLTKIKIPSGGGLTFTYEDFGDEIELKELNGIIVYRTSRRAYWKESFGEGDKIPDCHSKDLVSGTGKEGEQTIKCSTCPKNQFGSDGAGKACKESELLFILLPDRPLPVMLKLPPTSLKPYRQYGIGLMGRGYKTFEVVTNIHLEKTTNGKFTYGVAKFKPVGSVDPDLLPKVRQFNKMFSGLADTIVLEKENYDTPVTVPDDDNPF